MKVAYCLGKVAGDGQEGVFRDIFVNGNLVAGNFGHGQSLWGQTLQGAVGSAAMAGGMVGAAALLRPDKTYQSVGSANVQGQEQAYEGYQEQAYEGTVSPTVSAEATGGNSAATAASAAVSKSESAANSSASQTKQAAPKPVKKPKKPNHSGGGDNTNPGNGGNEGGYNNPGYGHKH